MSAGDPPKRFVRLLKKIAVDLRPESLEMQLCVMADTDQRDLLRRVASLTLLIWGEHDARSPLNIASDFEAAIPDATLVVLPRAGHLSNLEQPKRFNEAVRSVEHTLRFRRLGRDGGELCGACSPTVPKHVKQLHVRRFSSGDPKSCCSASRESEGRVPRGRCSRPNVVPRSEPVASITGPPHGLGLTG